MSTTDRANLCKLRASRLKMMRNGPVCRYLSGPKGEYAGTAAQLTTVKKQENDRRVYTGLPKQYDPAGRENCIGYPICRFSGFDVLV